MLTQVAEGVLVHQSELLRNNAVVVQGRAGVLLVDPGITAEEMTCLADDLRSSGRRVVAGFATHPDWDHALWHPAFGEAPRYGTEPCAAFLRELLSRSPGAEIAGLSVSRPTLEDVYLRLVTPGPESNEERP